MTHIKYPYPFPGIEPYEDDSTGGDPDRWQGPYQIPDTGQPLPLPEAIEVFPAQVYAPAPCEIEVVEIVGKDGVITFMIEGYTECYCLPASKVHSWKSKVDGSAFIVYKHNDPSPLTVKGNDPNKFFTKMFSDAYREAMK